MVAISLSNINFSYNKGDDLFVDLSCTIGEGQHIAIIGDNGVGKTTLLKIISGELSADSGHIVTNGTCVLLNQFNISTIKSGGQTQMDAIASVFDSGENILLLDEPTNNLDTVSRKVFYTKLRQFKGTVIIVSHDRELLNMMDCLLELHNGKISVFGGNYDFYLAQKQAQQYALESKYTDTQKNIARLIQTKIKAQYMRQNHEKKQAKDKSNNASGSRIEANNIKGKSQETEAKRRKIIDKKLDTEIATMQELSSQMRNEPIKIPLSRNVMYGKDIVIIDNMSFGYTPDKPIFKNFFLHIRGGDKIHLAGENGTGKTTLIKLICGVLQPQFGSVRTLGHIAYLDQNLSLLDKNKSIVENIADVANIKIHDAHAIAANFGFRGDASKKLVKTLSGGELLKATLAAVIGSENQPELLILDEPTNNLDIKSTNVLENALQEYRGTVLLVSHDKIFVQNTGITNQIQI